MHDRHKMAVAGTEPVNLWRCDSLSNRYDTLSPTVNLY